MDAKKITAIAIVIFFVVVIPVLGFVAGLIHPYAAFFFVIIVGNSAIMLVPCLLIILVYFLFRLIFPKQKRAWAGFLICIEGMFFTIISFSLSQIAAFYGLFLHYKTTDSNFEDVRTWAQTVEFDSHGIYWKRHSEGFPEPIAQFEPMYFSVRQFSNADPSRIVHLSWSSGLACLDYSLVIVAQDADYEPHGMSLQVEPGVYLESR